jgi:hypothetical protein
MGTYINPNEPVESTESTGRVGDLLHRITDDVKVIAKNEVELAKTELGHTARVAAGEAAVVVLGGIVALIGFAMLCTAAVVALAPVIPSLALRLVLMAFIYLIGGGVVAGVFAKKLGHDAKPDLAVPAYEAKRTIAGAKETLSHS